MKRVIEEEWGWCGLVLSLVWVGMAFLFFPARIDPLAGADQRVAGLDRVQVVYEPQPWAQADVVFPAGRAEDYRRKTLRVWDVRTVVEKPKTLPLTVPVRARIRPTTRLRPDPGPSLEGAGQVPRY